MTRMLGALLLAALPVALWAQNEEPAVNTEDQPAVNTERMAPARQPPAETAAPSASPPAATAPGAAKPASSPAPAVPDDPSVHKAEHGTTVVGEQEAPIGLYITPWRNSAAAGGLDRPARLLDEALMPLDPDEFSRYVNYNRALTQWLQRTGKKQP